MSRRSRPVAVVSGGSTGLGAFVCTEFLSRGFDVVNLDREASTNRKLRNVIVELSDLECVNRVALELSSEFEYVGLDVLVNLACDYYLSPLSEYTDLARLATASVVNIAAPLLLVSRFTKALNRGSYPLVINVSSNAALGSPFAAHYSMSKGALNSLTLAINEEFRINGTIRASTVMFGSIDVGFTHRENIRAITPIAGKDPVLSPETAAGTLVDLAVNRSNRHLPEILVLPHKLNIRQ